MDEVEFPDYCIMQGRHQALVKIAAMDGHRKSRNGCIGCGLYDCFGNSKYQGEINEKQRESFNKWGDYISKQIDLE